MKHRPDWMPTFRYRWTYTPTGIIDTREAQFIDKQHFLEAINHWNQLGNPTWEYVAL